MENAEQVSDFSLEQAFRRIKEIQQLLQVGELTFDESLALFVEAEKLIKQSQQYLSQAELNIQYLTGQHPDKNEP